MLAGRLCLDVFPNPLSGVSSSFMVRCSHVATRIRVTLTRRRWHSELQRMLRNMDDDPRGHSELLLMGTEQLLRSVARQES